ncbi:MAG: hypothetical protein H0W86_07530 [Armatimonadetes bacterium]|nr:hypothetical protein [Armatimonadota bacterium]
MWYLLAVAVAALQQVNIQERSYFEYITNHRRRRGLMRTCGFGPRMPILYKEDHRPLHRRNAADRQRQRSVLGLPRRPRKAHRGGLSFTETALTGLPENKPDNGMDGYEFVLMMPKQAGSTGISHVSIDWNPKGHIPPGVYDVPHFDVHFYLASTKERMKMTLDEASMKKCQKKPDAKLLPAGYIYAPQGEVKYMGAHWVDVKSPELNGSPFTHTFIYGTYDARVVFLEPMVTRAFLEGKAAVNAPIKQPETYQLAGKYFPTKYMSTRSPSKAS